MDYPIVELDRRLAALIQAGSIAEVDHAAARCRIRVGQWTSALLPWHSLAAGQVRHWRAPSVGEQALLIAPSGEPAAGFVLPGFYSEPHGQAGERRAKVLSWRMPDGCLIEYDWEAGALQVSGSKKVSVDNAETVSIVSGGQVTLQCPALVVDCASTTFKGRVSVEGGVSVKGDLGVDGNVDAAGAVMDSGGNSNHHKH
jgi:phage baseplate assembly protein V